MERTIYSKFSIKQFKHKLYCNRLSRCNVRISKRNVEQVYQEKNIEPDNVVLTRFDIERILMILDKSDNIQRIYINFVIHGQKENIERKDLLIQDNLKNTSNFYQKMEKFSLKQMMTIYLIQA